MPKQKVLVLYGGKTEREISIMSGKNVANALSVNNIDYDLFDWSRQSVTEIQQKNYTQAFVVLHGGDGENGVAQGFLETIKLPYTGSGVKSSALCYDKIYCQNICQQHNLPIVATTLVNEQSDIHKLAATYNFPLCMKPVSSGSSIGISKMNNGNNLKQEFIQAYEKAYEFDSRVMLQPWLTGKEYTVAICNNKAFDPILIEPEQEFYDYKAKYFDENTVFDPLTNLANEQKEYLKKLALQAFNIMECYDWGRVDFISDQDNNFYIIDINTVPGLTTHSLVPAAAKNIGVSFEQLVMQILNNANLKHN